MLALPGVDGSKPPRDLLWSFGLFRREVSHPDDYHLIDYRTEDFEACARQATDGRGVELILDAVGRDFVKEGLPFARAHRQARRVWRFLGGHEQDGREVWLGVYARQHAVASVQSLVFDERKQGCLRRKETAQPADPGPSLTRAPDRSDRRGEGFIRRASASKAVLLFERAIGRGHIYKLFPEARRFKHVHQTQQHATYAAQRCFAA